MQAPGPLSQPVDGIHSRQPWQLDSTHVCVSITHGIPCWLEDLSSALTVCCIDVLDFVFCWQLVRVLQQPVVGADSKQHRRFSLVNASTNWFQFGLTCRAASHRTVWCCCCLLDTRHRHPASLVPNARPQATEWRSKQAVRVNTKHDRRSRLVEVRNVVLVTVAGESSCLVL